MNTILNIDNKPFEDKSEAEATINALKHLKPSSTYELNKLDSGFVIIDTTDIKTFEDDATALPGESADPANTTQTENNNFQNNNLEDDATALGASSAREDLFSAQPQELNINHDDATATAGQSARDINLVLKPSFLASIEKPIISITLLSMGVYLKFSFDVQEFPLLAQQTISFLATATLALSPIPFLTHLWNRLSTSYYVNENEIRIKKGIIGRKGDSIMPEDIRKIELEQTFIQRILNVGNISFSSSGTEEEKIIFKGIKNPVQIRNEINRLSKELKQKQKFK